YGTFIGFKQHRDGNLYFCSCAREAIENFLRYEQRNSDTSSYSVSPEKVVEDDFPEEFRIHVENAEIDNIRETIGIANFEDRICHKCNDVVPNRRYSHEMYGTVFDQNYGWYVNQKKCEYGLPESTLRSGFAGEFLNCLPEDVIDIVDADGKDELEAKAARFAALTQKRSQRRETIRSVQRAETNAIRDKQQSGELSFDEARERRRELKNKYDVGQLLPEEEHTEWNRLQDELGEYVRTIAEAAGNEVRRAVGH
ncbi:hypothetical protein, partial [Halorubrum sp. Atlit-26R]|uniref:hypothetical protein n=1 Tax=Halorubrum sp. Atlit-26R TaxID=2282128 RepID=UPI0018F4E1E3